MSHPSLRGSRWWGAIGAVLFCACGCAGKSIDVGANSSGGNSSGGSGTYASTTPQFTTTDAGTATPFHLADRQFKTAGPFVVSGDQIFWFAYDSTASSRGNGAPSQFLRRCSTENCASTSISWTLGSGSTLAPPQLLSDSNRLFWVNQSDNRIALRGCAKDDCSAPKPFLLDPPSGSFALSGNQFIQTAPTGLFECSTDDCASTARTVSVVASTTALDLSSFEFLVADSEYAYVANSVEIARLPIDGSALPQFIAHDQHDIASLTLHGDSLFWTETGPLGAVRTCPKTGCLGEPREIIGGRLNPRTLAVDDQAIYFVEGGQTERLERSPQPVLDQVFRCPISGCTAPTLMAAKQGVDELEVDDKYLYFNGRACADGNDDWFGEDCGFIAVVPK